MPAVVYRKIDLSLVQTKYFYLMTSSLILGVVISILARLLAHFKPGAKSNINPKGNTGNLIVDFFNGREFNPSLLGKYYIFVKILQEAIDQEYLKSKLLGQWNFRIAWRQEAKDQW